MKKILILIALVIAIVFPSVAEQPFYLAYPRANHQTSSEQIFFIGTAPPTGEVRVNGKVIPRSPAGHFAPSFPLQLGKNIFTFRYQNRERRIEVTRVSGQPTPPTGLAFAKDSLTPKVDIAKLPEEPICFSAIAPPNATVTVKLGGQIIPLIPQPLVNLLPNFTVLTGQNQSSSSNNSPNTDAINRVSNYQGCATADAPANLGLPQFQLTINGKTITQMGRGTIKILSPTQLEIAEVIVDAGVARSGPSTDYSRLTPLPKGTRSTVTGREGDWVRLDYGGWINSQEVRIIPGAVPPRSIIRSISSRQVDNTTEVTFPLQVPVPVSVQQGDRTLTLTLYNTTAQTDIIRLDDDPIISRLDWQQVAPSQVQYNFNLKSGQQWGYKLRYEGTNLILSLRHPPSRTDRSGKPLSGIKILLDPGHGGTESGAIGPTGYPEKDVNLVMSKLLREQLAARGATVYVTREDDRTLSLPERVATIDKLEPAIALSIHYNSLPDSGDAMNTKGFGTFWYHVQAHSLAMFIHNYIVEKVGRPSYGVYWNNLALARPYSAPSILLEMGFMSNPFEFEWVVNPQEQRKMAEAIANGITEWFANVR